MRASTQKIRGAGVPPARFLGITAAFSIALAVSWGPLSAALRVVEVSERGERTVRVELAQNDAPSRSKTTQKNSAKSDSKTERLLKAAPDNLEIARAIHFDLCAAPLAPSIVDYIGSAEARHAAYAPRIAEAPDIDSQPARGPPLL